MPSGWLRLSGKVCVVTGGAGGIGQAIVREFLSAGARVAILDRSADAVTAFAGEQGENAIGIACDVTSESDVSAALNQVIRAFGKCDILVNNAGVIQPIGLMGSTLEQWRAGTAVNLDSYYICARIFGEAIVANGGGAIVHVGSIAAELPQPNGLGYSAAKAGIVALSRQIAIEWGSKGIRSNVVNPGMTQTPMTAKLNADPEIVKKRAALTASKRLGQPEDIANIVAFLASDRSGYVNGADLMATGGMQSMMMTMIPQPGLKPTTTEEVA